jgi:tetratricopeptide (TPR) repeat protein
MRIASVLVVGSIWASAPTYAQPGDNTTMAEQLFNQGRDAAAKGDWANACPKFEASLRYDPALGTRLNLANCYEKVGKVAKAWGMYRDAADKAATVGDIKRKEYALEQAAKLEPRLPKLTIVAPAKPPVGFTITRDGSPVDAAMFGGGFYVDPGAHEIVASAPGYASITKSVRVDEGKAETVTIPDLEAKPEAPKESKPGSRPQVDDEAPMVAPPPNKTWKYVGLGTAAGGVVMLGVGIAFGAKAKSTYSDAKSVCGADLVCQNTDDFAKGQKLISDARSQATLSTVFVVGGAALAAGGVALWLFAPTGGAESRPKGVDAHVVPHASPSDVGVSLVGRF